MGRPDFWEDSERASAISGEHARATRRLEGFRALQADVADLDGLVELGAEDASLQHEVDEQIASVAARLAELEEQRLFSGRYDAGGAPPFSPSMLTCTLKIMRAKSVQTMFMRSPNSVKASFL